MLCFSTGSWLATTARLELSPSPLQFHPVAFLHRPRVLTPRATQDARALASTPLAPQQQDARAVASTPLAPQQRTPGRADPSARRRLRGGGRRPLSPGPSQARARGGRPAARARTDTSGRPFPARLGSARLPSLCACATRRGGDVCLPPLPPRAHLRRPRRMRGAGGEGGEGKGAAGRAGAGGAAAACAGSLGGGRVGPGALTGWTRTC